MLKSNPVLRDLEHVQADGPRLAYLFFYDRHGYHGLSQEEALSMCSHMTDAFAKWIGRSACFDVVPLLLEAGRQHTTAMQEKRMQCVRPLEEPILPVQVNKSTSSGSSQLVGGAPPVPEVQQGVTEPEMQRLNVARPRS